MLGILKKGGLCAVALTLMAALPGCSSKGMMDLRTNSDGPDEFLVLPSKPLQIPQNIAALPAPTPGGSNITDPTPSADLVAALGGNPNVLDATGVPVGDSALVAQASRYGVDGEIREELAEADARFRKRASFLGRIRLTPIDRYSQAYRRQDIEPFDEIERYRASGYPTPSSPPFTLR